VVVEASAGQLEDEMRLALSKAEVAHPPSARAPQGRGAASQNEIVDAVLGVAGKTVEAKA